ncbi:hypothetical protein NCS55_01312900 [Fusarium keratoplasticum]|nr:hypothetical protein NCS55_01312900 [Fusarium keratoplasticum]
MGEREDDYWPLEAGEAKKLLPKSRNSVRGVVGHHVPLPLYTFIKPYCERPSYSDIFTAIKSENLSWFRSLLSTGLASLWDIDENGRTLWHYALLWEEGTHFCRLLLDNGAAGLLGVIPHRASRIEATPLHVAIQVIYNKMKLERTVPTWAYTRTRWLLEAGADVHVSDMNGMSCFDLAFHIDDYELQRTIIPYTDVDVLETILVAETLRGPLLQQWLRDSLESTLANLRLLVKSGACPDARSSVGQNCLHICIQFADSRKAPNALRRALVELISQGADVNATDHSGNTVTDVAFRRLDPREVKTMQVSASRGSEGLDCFKAVWRDILHLAAEWQSTGLCCDRISIMLQNRPSQVDLEPILLQHLLGVYEELDFLASIFEDDMKSQDELRVMASEENGNFANTAALYRKLFRDMQGIELLDQEFFVSSSRKQTLHHFCLLTQAVGLAMLLQQQCHTGHIHPYFLQYPVSSITLEGYEDYHNTDRPEYSADFGRAARSYDEDLKITARLQDLTCAGKMLGGPVFVFTTIPKQTEPAMLYGSCEDLVDTFGQCSIISVDADNRLNTVVGVRIGGGTIFPTQGTSSSGQRLFHWGDFPTNIDEPSTFGYTEKILIGAPVTNNDCTLKEEDARREANAAGALSLVHVLKPFWFKDQIQAGLQGGHAAFLGRLFTKHAESFWPISNPPAWAWMGN